MATFPGVYIDENGQFLKPPAAQSQSGTSGAPAYTGPGTATVPTPTPAPAPAPTITTSPGFTPDYDALIKSDPAYGAAQSAAQLAQSNASAARRAALRSAVIRYGGMPAGFTDQYGDLDQGTLDTAQNNSQSVLANLAHDYSQSEEQFKRGLAARGALQSGDLNYGEDQLQRGYAQQQYDAANQVGDQAQQDLSQYSGVLASNAQNMASAVQGAESNVLSNPAYTPSSASYANYDAASAAQYGQPIYKDPNGVLYDANGNVFTPSAPSGTSGAPAPAPAPSAPDNTYYQYSPTTQQLTSQVGRPATGLWMQ